MKKISRNWTEAEDRILMDAMSDTQKKMTWDQIAGLMNQKNQKCQKTGKQCRERWHNQLAPELNNSGKWEAHENKVLFTQHNNLGNKWAKIAALLQGRTDNCVKNHFYSTLRRGMRKVNLYIHDIRKERTSLKEFKPDVLTKILIIADGDPDQKLTAKERAKIVSKQIKEILIELSLEESEEPEIQKLQRVIKLITEFNKNCKKRKGKRKGPTNAKDDLHRQSQNQEMEQEEEQVEVAVEEVKQKEKKKGKINLSKKEEEEEEQKPVFPNMIEYKGENLFKFQNPIEVRRRTEKKNSLQSWDGIERKLESQRMDIFKPFQSSQNGFKFEDNGLCFRFGSSGCSNFGQQILKGGKSDIIDFGGTQINENSDMLKSKNFDPPQNFGVITIPSPCTPYNNLVGNFKFYDPRFDEGNNNLDKK